MFNHTTIWAFNAPNRPFAGGIFADLGAAAEWIRVHRLTGVFTAYPLDRGVFDWAVENQCTGLKPEKLEAKRSDPLFVGGFTTAAQEHYHYEDGEPA